MPEEESKTLWVGNLPEQITEEILYELFLQAGPLEQVRIPKERDGRPKNFGFVTYRYPVSVPYAIGILKGTALFNKTLSIQCRDRIAQLPPPIRCYGPEKPGNFGFNPGNEVRSQFADMAARLNGEDLSMMRTPREMDRDALVMASLQGNWHTRHHPYRHGENEFKPRERDHRGDRGRDRERDKRSSNHWRDRDRRNQRRGRY